MLRLTKLFFYSLLFLILAVCIPAGYASDSNCTNHWYAFTPSSYAGSSIGSTANGHTICRTAMGNNNWYWVEFHDEGAWEVDGRAIGTIPKPETCGCSNVGWNWINDQNAECYETGNQNGIVAARHTRTCDNCGDAVWFYAGCSPYSGQCPCSNSFPLFCGCVPGSYDCRVGVGAPCSATSDCMAGTCTGGVCTSTMCVPQGSVTNMALNATATAIGYTPDFGSPPLIVNGTFAPEGTSWANGSYAVRVWDNTRYLRVELQAVYSIGRVRVQADDNDTYYVTRWTGSTWVLHWQVPYSSGGGLRTRDSGTIANYNGAYWAIYPVGGDGSYSVSEIELYAPGDWIITDTQTCDGVGTGIAGKIRIQGSGLLVIKNGGWVTTNDVWIEKSGQAINIYSSGWLYVR